MTISTFAPGVDTSFSSKLNSNFYDLTLRVYVASALNLIRQLQDRAVNYSVGYLDMWGDAFIDADGRSNSVNAGLTTASYYAGGSRYRTAATNGTVENLAQDGGSSFGTTVTTTGTITNPGFFNTLTFIQSVNTGGTIVIKKGSTTIASYSGSGNVITATLTQGDYSEFFAAGDTFNIVYTAGGASSITYKSGHTYSGTNWSMTSQPLMRNDSALVAMGYTPVTAGSSVVVMNIPAGTFPAGITSAIGVPQISTWETGADIKYKLSNGTDDSGYLACANTPDVKTFTAFASAPTLLTVQLTPKSTNPTLTSPSISGFVVMAK